MQYVDHSLVKMIKQPYPKTEDNEVLEMVIQWMEDSVVFLITNTSNYSLKC